MSVGKSSAEPASSPTPATSPRDRDGSRLLGPEALRAYAHPLRLAILRYLHDHDHATATTLAAHLGESTGQTSYHLRQLAKHGIVEDVPGMGTGRERWWQQAAVTVDVPTMRHDPGATTAAGALLDATLAERQESLGAWMRHIIDHGEEPWAGRALHSQTTLVLTPDELGELSDELQDVVTRALDRVRDRRLGARPEGSMRVRVFVDAFPLIVGDAPPGP